MMPSDFQLLANHLWQSTLFAAVAGLLTLALKNNRAQTRYWLWLTASLKFLIPFSLLIQAGAFLQRAPAYAPLPPSPLAIAFEQVSQPFAAPARVTTAVATHDPTNLLPAILIAAWAIGFVTLATSWWRRWRHLRAAIRAASPLHLPVNVEVLSSPAVFEPGVFGIRRPVLLLPDGIADHLSPAQLDAILAHELCHIRRRDNLATALHMTVEALFWFHPLVWWLGARLMQERERACDEDVLRRGNDPEVYAEGILKVCELYLAQPLACVAGVTGANLKQRIEDIMTDRATLRLNASKKTLLAATALLAVAGPVVLGLTDAPQLRAQSKPAKFDVASIKPHAPGSTRYNFPGFRAGGRFQSSAPLSMVVTSAFGLPFNSTKLLEGLPNWTGGEDAMYDIEATGTIPSGLSDQAREQRERSMIVSLLADRFQMKYHLENKELPVYNLVVGKGGPKLTKADISEKECAAVSEDAAPTPGMMPQQCHGFNGGQGRGLHARAATIQDMVNFVANWTEGRPLLDKTGLKGLYKFETRGWRPIQLGPSPADGAKGEDGALLADQPTLFEVFEEMGLRMEAAKAKVDVVVIDHIERPSEN